jgi:predicted ATPase
MRHFKTGIELLATLPDTSARTQRELVLHIALGVALIAVKGHASPEVEQAYLKARELCQRTGEPTELALVLVSLWQFYATKPQLQAAQEVGESLLRLARNSSDPALVVIAGSTFGFTRHLMGELLEGRQHLEDSIAQYADNVAMQQSDAVSAGNWYPLSLFSAPTGGK